MGARVQGPAAVVLALAAVLAVVLGGLPGTVWVAVPKAGAQPSGGPTTTATTTPGRAGDSGGAGSTDAELAIIMDASSSMLEPDEGGTRLDVAKRAATDLVDSLPETSRVGMLAYGTQVGDAPENHAPGCEDIRTLAPVGAVDKDRLRAEIAGLEARGYTPIGNSLRAAADMLSPDASERSIVLVSDGIDTCAPPPPCEVAAELADEGVGLAVHVVGFRADEATRAELECIADTTGGTYRQADDAAALSESLQFLAQRAIVSYETTGTEFEFADTPQDALYVGQGLYQTTEEAVIDGLQNAPVRYIRVAVPEGHRAWVSITPIPEIDLTDQGGGQGISVRAEAVNDSGEACRSDTDSGTAYGGGFEPPEAAVVQLGRTVDRQDLPACDHSAWVVEAKFAADSFAAEIEEVRVEMSVQFEPIPGNEIGTWPSGIAGGQPDASPVTLTDAEPVIGGNSFNNATAVTEGTFSDSVVPGEFRFYRFPVESGQRPVVTGRVPPSVRDGLDSIRFKLYGPMRHNIAGESMSVFGDQKESTFSVDRPILYRNREANAGGRDRALAGEHYLAVSMNVGSSGGALGVEQPFEFAISAEGEPAGGPDWVPVNEPGPTPSSSPIGMDDAAPDGEVTGGDGDDDDSSLVAAPDEDSVLPGWLIPGGVGVVVLLLVGIGLGLWIGRRGRVK